MADRWTRLAELSRARRERAAGPDRARHGRARAGGARAGGRRRGVRPRREVRRRQLLRPVREARADRARRSRHARLRAVRGTASACSSTRRSTARASRSPASPRRTCSTTSTTTLVGRDRLPRVKELSEDRRRALDELVHRPRAASAPGRSSSTPSSPEDDAYEQLWSELEHVLRLDEPDPVAGVGRADGRAERVREPARRAPLRRDRAARARAPS